MKKTLLALTMVALMAFTGANKQFPDMSVKALNGKQVNLPADLKGKFAVIAIAYSIKAQTDLNSWYAPIMSNFFSSNLMPVNVYFIPMTKSIGISDDKVEAKLKQSIDKDLYGNVLLYKEDPKEYIKELGMSKKDEPYIFVVDPNGDITYVTSGAYTEQKMDTITDKVSE
jgi:alkyl hydroperoxide reductase subunit AhpC